MTKKQEQLNKAFINDLESIIKRVLLQDKYLLLKELTTLIKVKK